MSTHHYNIQCVILFFSSFYYSIKWKCSMPYQEGEFVFHVNNSLVTNDSTCCKISRDFVTTYITCYSYRIREIRLLYCFYFHNIFLFIFHYMFFCPFQTIYDALRNKIYWYLVVSGVVISC